MEKYPCSAYRHHETCDGFVRIPGNAYSETKINNKKYYTRYACTLADVKELVPLRDDEKKWLRKFILDNCKREDVMASNILMALK